MTEIRRDAADRTWLALDIEERKVSLRGRVEFNDLRNCETVLKRFPDIAAKAVAASQSQAAMPFATPGRRIQEIAAEFADILNLGAIPAADIAPKAARGEFFGDDGGTAGNQRCHHRHNAPDTVVERQTVIHAIFRRISKQPLEPQGPDQKSAMADTRRLGQTGGAGCVDQQSGIVDGDLLCATSRNLQLHCSIVRHAGIVPKPRVCLALAIGGASRSKLRFGYDVTGRG